MPEPRETIAAIATAPGRGGIGVVRVSGPRSLEIAASLTGRRPVPRRATLCQFRDTAGGVIDQGLLIYFQAPASYTGEDVIELQGHGGRVVVGMVLEAVLARGARMANPGEFTERAFLNDRLDLLQAEAVADLIDSASRQAATSAIRSLQGAFSTAIDELLAEVIGIRVYLEGALDFPEEEIDFLSGSDIRARLEALQAMLESLIEKANKGHRLRAGIRIAIIGLPNVGKSSLLNALLGQDRAIVTEIAGTTRDVIEDDILLDGLMIRIVDTAGLRDTADPVEQEGVRRTRREVETADALLLVTDSPAFDSATDPLITGTMKAPGPCVIVHNKIDERDELPRIETISGVTHVYVSARTGAGMEMLLQTLADLHHLNAGEDVFMARDRHLRALQEARSSVQAALEACQKNLAPELVAEDLRQTQSALADITGAYHNEELLGEIFSRFCIGK